MHRRWRVRHSYPQPVVELVRLLLAFQGVREISALLDIPASVIYRWRAGKRIGITASENWFADAQTIATLAEKCDETGFRATERLHSADGPTLQPIIAALRQNRAARGQGAPGDAASVPARGGERLVEPARQQEAAVAFPIAEPPSRPRGAQPRYAFDARKERSSRRVRRRLEAARRMIEAEYFLDLDSRTLADAAQMSPHHFIRMFNQMYGRTPHQYLLRARIEAAKRLLLASREPIEVIAAGVGFRSGPSLNRAFKQVEGASVSRFCQTARNKHPSNAPRNAGPGAAAPGQHAL